MNTRNDLEQTIQPLIEQYKNSQTKEFIPGVTPIPVSGKVYDHKELQAIISAALDECWTEGKVTKQFEERMASYIGVKHAISCNSGSSANLLALMALKSPSLKNRLWNRDEIITTTSSFPTTVNPIIQAGCIPVFIDSDIPTYNIQAHNLFEALNKRTKGVMIAHSLGNPFNLEAIMNFCEKYKLWLIEDNCDALGSTYDGKKTGAWGDIGTSSFYPPHHITMGEGGATYTNNPLLKKIMLSLRDWGRDCWCESGVDNTCKSRFTQSFGNLPKGYDHKYVYSHFGFNLKATDMQAAIGVAQLEKLPYFTKKRIENFNKLYNELKDLEEFTFVKAQPNSNPSWFGFMLTLNDNTKFTRNDIVQYLENNNIQTRNLFAGNMLKHPMFNNLQKDVDYRVIGDLQNTDKIMNDSFWIGVYPNMSNEMIEYMIKKIKEYLRLING